MLDEAARGRLSCQVMLRGSGWTRGWFVRVDKSGVVLTVPELSLRGGEDLRVWFSLDEVPFTFEASVLRAGVPVPDRSSHGVMLGFIGGWVADAAPPADGTQGLGLTVLPHNGRGVELVGGPARLVDLRVDELAFTVPHDVALKFVQGGQVRLRFSRPGQAPYVASGRVQRLLRGEGHYLYGVRFEDVGDPRAHMEAVEALRGSE